MVGVDEGPFEGVQTSPAEAHSTLADDTLDPLGARITALRSHPRLRSRQSPTTTGTYTQASAARMTTLQKVSPRMMRDDAAISRIAQAGRVFSGSASPS
jgi:hypothetical protein